MARLTIKNYFSTLALLIPHWFVGISWELLHCRKVERGEVLLSSTANEREPGSWEQFQGEHAVAEMEPGSFSHGERTGRSHRPPCNDPETAFRPARLSHLRPEPPDRGVRAGQCAIPGSARHEHDNKPEKTGGNPPSGRENPELPFLVLRTPRKYKNIAKPSGEDAKTETQSWNCACN
jgi:hypothetical protein